MNSPLHLSWWGGLFLLQVFMGTFSINRALRVVAAIIVMGLLGLLFRDKDSFATVAKLKTAQVKRLEIQSWTEEAGSRVTVVSEKDSIAKFIALLKGCGEDGSRVNLRNSFGAYNLYIVCVDSIGEIPLHITDSKFDGGVIGFGGSLRRCDDVTDWIKHKVAEESGRKVINPLRTHR